MNNGLDTGHTHEQSFIWIEVELFILIYLCFILRICCNSDGWILDMHTIRERECVSELQCDDHDDVLFIYFI